jgi:regulator of sigma E protease
MLLTLITFFAVLGVLVLVHELGHFVVARKFGVKVEEFGFGLPPRLVGFYRNEDGRWQWVGLKTKTTAKTIWSLNWIPLGGFVKIKGEEGGQTADLDSFAYQSVWRRILIISAGVTMNVILAAVLLSFGLGIGLPQIIDNNLPSLAQVKDVAIRVIEILPDSPASQAGLMIGDSLLTIDNLMVTEIEELQNYLQQKIGLPVNLIIKRQAEVINLVVTPQVISQTQKGGLGVALVTTGLVSYPWYLTPYYGITEALKMVGGVIFGFYLIIKNLIISQELIGEVYGPVGIASLVGDAARLGFLYVLQFTAVLSVIIAVINFLPFPALDGGRVLFLLIEALRKRPINQKLEAAMHNIGFALLMVLVVIVTFRDIARVSSGFLNWWQKISGLF